MNKVGSQGLVTSAKSAIMESTMLHPSNIGSVHETQQQHIPTVSTATTTITPIRVNVNQQANASAPVGQLNRGINITTTTNSSNTNILSNLSNLNGHLVETVSQQTRNIEQASSWLELPKMENFVDIISLCCSTAVIFGGLVPYVPQYLKIKQSRSSGGFSTYGKLIFCNV